MPSLAPAPPRSSSIPDRPTIPLSSHSCSAGPHCHLLRSSHRYTDSVDWLFHPCSRVSSTCYYHCYSLMACPGPPSQTLRPHQRQQEEWGQPHDYPYVQMPTFVQRTRAMHSAQGSGWSQPNASCKHAPVDGTATRSSPDIRPTSPQDTQSQRRQ